MMKLFKGKYSRLAFKVAKEAHDGQFDKCGVPYIMHLVRVANYTKSSVDEINAIALLHDTLEDTYLSISDLRAFGFSERIIDAVILLTKEDEIKYFDYIRNIADSGNMDAIIVKLADLKDNSDPNRVWAVEDPERIVKRYAKAKIILEEALTRFPVASNM